MDDFIACAIQFWAQPNSPKHNLSQLEGLIDQAMRNNNPQLIVFQESCLTGFTPNMPFNEFAEIVEPIPGPATNVMCDLAARHDVNIVFPLYERDELDGKIYNSACVIASSGKLLGVHRKTHPFPLELEWTTPGNRVEVFDLGICKLGVIICYEGDFPEVSRLLTLKGAEVIARPSALMRSIEIWDLTNRSRAYDNNVHVIAVNSIGRDAGDNYFFGHSSIYSPIAERLVQAQSNEEIIYAKISKNASRYISYGSKSPMRFNHIADRNLSVCGEGCLS